MRVAHSTKLARRRERAILRQAFRKWGRQLMRRPLADPEMRTVEDERLQQVRYFLEAQRWRRAHAAGTIDPKHQPPLREARRSLLLARTRFGTEVLP